MMQRSQRSSLEQVVGASRSGGDWSGVAKLAAITAVAVGVYFVYRHGVVTSSTVRGLFGAKGKSS